MNEKIRKDIRCRGVQLYSSLFSYSIVEIARSEQKYYMLVFIFRNGNRILHPEYGNKQRIRKKESRDDLDRKLKKIVFIFALLYAVVCNDAEVYLLRKSVLVFRGRIRKTEHIILHVHNTIILNEVIKFFKVYLYI